MAPNRWPNAPMPSGVSYADLPITDPNCMNMSCKAFAAGWNESQDEIPLMTLVNYSYWTMTYYMTWIIIFVVAHMVHVLSDRFTRARTPGSPPRAGWTHKLAASYRSIAYRRFGGWWTKLGMPSLGLFALLALSTIFFICLLFPGPAYLRSRFRFGSPPLSVRCAMTISALLPLLIALAGKVNMFTWVTGASYAELNIFHRYIGGVLFALATMHTVPHLVAPIQDGGYDMLAQLFIWKRRELSGVILYFVFICLMLLSIPAVRRRFYEFFVFTHIFLGVSFFGLLWWHIKGEYASPIYIYTTVGIFILSNLLRILQRNKSVLHGKLGGFPTRIERLPGKITKLTVEVPAALRWKAGQHSYVRMPRGVSNIFDNHPFTIASIPSTSGPSQQSNKMVFLIRAHRGFTGALERRAILCEEEQKIARPGLPSSPSFASATTTTTAASSIRSVVTEKPNKNASTYTVDDVERSTTAATATTMTEIFATPTRALGTIIDGPYGTYVPPLHRTFDTVVLVAAGTGITAALPYALDLSRQLRDGGADGCSSTTVQEVRLVWTIRDDAWIEWVRSEFESIVRTAGAGKIIVDVYVTGKKKAELPMLQQQQQYIPALPTAPPPAAAFVPHHHHDEMMMMQPLAISGTAAGRRAALSLFPPAGMSQCSSSATLAPPLPRPSEDVILEDVDVDEIKPSSPIHVTTTTTTSISTSATSSSRQLNIKYEGRPRMASLVPQLVGEAQGARAFVVGCGPEALKVELGNAVAGMQKDVFRGEMEKVVLHMETFGW
ncbi:putative ferric reductase protein [Lasiodiplodia theobromae]|nr:putative ferric reductase protein [Lasiodiplodia theobromae]